jgi:hypothetical protein
MQLAPYSPEINIALASLVVALVTTLFVLYQASLSRIHNRLSVRPHLVVEIVAGGQKGDNAVELRVSNNGLGPAIIKNHNVYFDKQLVGGTQDIRACRTKFIEIIARLAPHSYSNTFFVKDAALLPGDHRKLIKLQLKEVSRESYRELLEQHRASIKRFDAEIEYECMYGFKYKLDTRLVKEYRNF